MTAAKWAIGAVTAVAGAMGALWLWNYAAVGAPVGDALAGDVRNPSGAMVAHFAGYMDPSTLSLDLKADAAAVSCADISRMLFTSARAVGDRKFDRVLLARNGRPKFLLEGPYFSRIGLEYETGQNPVYLMRTLPENVFTLDSAPAYSTWTGGMIGVLGKQMDDLNHFCRDWTAED